jgi:hypothetical protein
MATIFPREMITDDNHSPIVNIVTWILLVSVVLSVAAKVAMKAIACHSFNTDDAVLTAAMVIPHQSASLLVLRNLFPRIRSSVHHSPLRALYRHITALDAISSLWKLRR